MHYPLFSHKPRGEHHVTNWTKIVDLSHELSTSMSTLGGDLTAFWDNLTFEMMERMTEGRVSFRTRIIQMNEHTGTHLDAPSHFDRQGTNVEEIPLESLVVPGHLLDLRHKAPHEAIGPEDLKEAIEASGMPIRSGTIVIAYTGQDVHWGEEGFTRNRPYVTAEGGKYLVDQGVTLFGTDLIGIDNPDEYWDPTHRAFLLKDVPMVQQLNNLGELVGKEFLFIVLPLPMKGGTASPVRPIALVA
jgi:kynurenine formamidase